MIKRILSLTLCLLMVISVFSGCAKNEDDLGAYINMYLTDQIYDLDPAYAYGNDAALKIVSLVFDNLFVIDENGKVKKSLAKDYTIREDDNTKEYEMIITLQDTCWTDGTAITANDVYFAWTRVLQSDSSFEAASLLFDIKNARAAKEGDVSIDDVAISALNEKQIRILFEEKIDYDQFLVKISSHALAPIREDIVTKTADWAKKPATICSSGPFRLREVSYKEGDEHITLERNPYYYRDIEKDDIDESVRPYRIIINYTMTDEEIMAAYNNGEIFFVGDIPLSVRNDYKSKAKVSDAMSTHTYVLNQDAVVRRYSAQGFKTLAKDQTEYITTYLAPASEKRNEKLAKLEEELAVEEGVDGDKIFANPDVRKAMSMVIDREKIAEKVVFAKAATALVPYGVFNDSAKSGIFSKAELFREVGGDLISTTEQVAEAQALIKNALGNQEYMFTISVAAYDEVHLAIAEMVADAWAKLGLHVSINAIDVIENDDYMKTIDETPKDIRDDIHAEAYRAGLFEVSAIDYVALSADAFGVLAPFAKCFTGGAASSLNSATFEIPTHLSGYNSEVYNAKIEQAFAEKDIEARASILHDAEKILMQDLPVIPIIFNQNAYLQSKDLSKVKMSYYGTFIFTDTKLKNYELYVPVEEKED